MTDSSSEAARVTTLELFFDLVFVFARAVAAAAALTTIPLGAAIAPVAQIAALVVLLAGVVVLEPR